MNRFAIALLGVTFNFLSGLSKASEKVDVIFGPNEFVATGSGDRKLMFPECTLRIKETFSLLSNFDKSVDLSSCISAQINLFVCADLNNRYLFKIYRLPERIENGIVNFLKKLPNDPDMNCAHFAETVLFDYAVRPRQGTIFEDRQDSIKFKSSGKIVDIDADFWDLTATEPDLSLLAPGALVLMKSSHDPIQFTGFHFAIYVGNYRGQGQFISKWGSGKIPFMLATLKQMSDYGDTPLVFRLTPR